MASKVCLRNQKNTIMPELPDIEVFKNEADKTLHKKINDVEVVDKEFVKTTEKKIQSDIRGQKIEKFKRQGKHLFLITGNHKMVAMHFGMTGYVKVRPQDEDPPDYTKCIFKLDNEKSLCYISKRKLGRIEMISDMDDYLKEYEVGPDALDIDKHYFLKQLENSKTMIKNFLTDQSVLSGIGNVYADEILFQAGIHPKEKASKMTEADGKKLFDITLKVLKKAIEKNADVSQLPQTWLLRSHNDGDNCPRCDDEIRKTKVSGRSAWYCPNCQKKK